jgi:hypothetical protein
MSRKRKIGPPDMAMRRVELEQLAQDRFAFLVEDKGFAHRPAERDVFATSQHYARTDVQLSVQVQLDFRDATVRVYLLRLQDGKLPLHGFVDVDRNVRIRIAFLSLLTNNLEVRDVGLDELSDVLSTPPSPGQPRDYAWADATLARWQDVVGRYLDMVVQQPLERLFPPPSPGASPADQA